MVRRALDVDPETGGRRWTDHAFLYGAYELSELGYAVTDHAAQSRTVHTGMQLITSSETRQQAYVGISRGTETNLALVFTVTPKPADPRPGTRPAPELARFHRLTKERVGEVLPGPRHGGREPVGVLADVLERDGAELSALETQERSFAAADNLAILHAQWQSEMSAAKAERYREMTMRALPEGYRGDPGHQASGCGALFEMPSWPGWTPRKYSAPQSESAILPGYVMWPVCWTPGSGGAWPGWSRSRSRPGASAYRGSAPSIRRTSRNWH